MCKSLKISVIMPVYNSEKYVVRTVESVLAQTYDNYELIIIDDGSTDGTINLLKDRYSTNPKISIKSIENQGVSNARNVGISLASGDFISFIDSDDYYSSTFLEKMVGIIEPNCDLIICGYNIVNHFKEKTSISKVKIEAGCFDYYHLYSKYFYYKEMGIFNPVWNKLFNTYIIKTNNLQFVKGQYMGEDLIFNLEFMRKSQKIKIIEDSLYNYVTNDDQTVVKPNIRYLDNIIVIYDMIKRELKSNGLFKINESDFINDYRKDIFASYINIIKSKNKRDEKLKYLKLLHSCAIENQLLNNIGVNIFFLLLKYKCFGSLLFIGNVIMLAKGK